MVFCLILLIGKKSEPKIRAQFSSLGKIARSANHATLQRPNLTNDGTGKNFSTAKAKA